MPAKTNKQIANEVVVTEQDTLIKNLKQLYTRYKITAQNRKALDEELSTLNKKMKEIIERL